MDCTSKSRAIMGKNFVNYFPIFSNILVLEKTLLLCELAGLYSFISCKFLVLIENFLLPKCQWRRSGIFIVNFEHILRLVLVFLLLTLSR